MFNALSAAVTRRPWFVIVSWLIVAGILATVGGAKLYDVTTTDTSSFLPTSYESAKAVKFGESHFGKIKGATNVTGLVTRRDHRALTPADQAAVHALALRFPDWHANVKALEKNNGAGFGFKGSFSKHMKEVRALDPSMLGVAGAGRDELVSLQFKGNAADPATMKAFKQFRTATIRAFGSHGLSIGFTGGIASETDLNDATKGRTQDGQYLLFAAIFLLTLIFFRGVLSSLLPLLLVTFVAQAAVGAVVLTALAFHYHFDSSVPQLIQVVLIGIGIDYFLFMVFRFREHLRNGEERKEAARKTAASVSRVVASAALAIVVAFASLGLAHFGQFRVLGPSVAIAVGVMLISGITLIPALLAATGRKLFWPSTSWQTPNHDGPAHRLGVFVANRPRRVVLLSAGVLLALAFASLGAKMSYDLGSLPKNAKAEQVQQRIDKLLPRGVTDQQQIYVSSPRALTVKSLQPMRARLAHVAYVGDVSQPVLADHGHAAEIDVSLTISSTTAKALKLAKAGGPLRTAAHESAPRGSTAMVAGTASIFADVSSSVNKDLRVIFPIAAVLILLILFLMLRSVVAPIYLLLAVGLEFVATLGASVLVFQHGMHHGGVVFTLPLVLFLFVVAIGTDYNILMSARLREEIEAGAGTREATVRAVRAVAPAIAAAGLVLAVSFSTLLLYRDINTREIGFAMAVGILLASLLVSTLLVPAMTTLVGPKAWWPRRMTSTAPSPSAEDDVEWRKAA